MTDLVVRGASVVDGTGQPARVADVAVADGRIAAITEPGRAAASPGADIVDATGLVLAPGFVDLHTHYDAQLLWDPAATPSPLHGVTTVFGGNCGFGIAPAGDDHAPYLARLLARVEGIPLDAIEAGVSWEWSDFAGWLGQLERQGIAVNAGFLAGHSAIRRAVMGERAVGEEATVDELDAMVALLHSMLGDGAMGLSTSRSATHLDGDGQPVPSRFATDEELLRLAAVVAEHPGTQVEAIVPGCISGFTDDETALLAALSAAADRPVNWNVLGVGAGDGHLAQLAMADRAAALGGRVVALTLPYSMSIRLSFLTGTVLEALPGWDEVFGQPPARRLELLADPEVRRRLDAGAQSPEAGLIGLLAKWERLQIIETFTPETAPWEGRLVRDVVDATGKPPFDALLDVVVADGLRTGLAPVMPADTDEVWARRLDVWRDPRAVIGGSDAGAHLDMMCGAVYSTTLLGEAVRERGLLPIEEAVALLTDRPARLYGADRRGRIAEGWHADLVLLDPATVGPRPQRTVTDLPGGASRLFAAADGIHVVFVGGTAIVRDGEVTGSTPGTLLRSGRDTVTVHAG
jgi:N-acyl-D-aspartate/D-glutamate deacylase